MEEMEKDLCDSMREKRRSRTQLPTHNPALLRFLQLTLCSSYEKCSKQ